MIVLIISFVDPTATPSLKDSLPLLGANKDSVLLVSRNIANMIYSTLPTLSSFDKARSWAHDMFDFPNCLLLPQCHRHVALSFLWAPSKITTGSPR